MTDAKEAAQRILHHASDATGEIGDWSYEDAQIVARALLAESLTGARNAGYMQGFATGRLAGREEAAKIADLAPGQDWSDDTTPAEMARFIARAIRQEEPARQ